MCNSVLRFHCIQRLHKCIELLSKEVDVLAAFLLPFGSLDDTLLGTVAPSLHLLLECSFGLLEPTSFER